MDFARGEHENEQFLAHINRHCAVNKAQDEMNEAGAAIQNELRCRFVKPVDMPGKQINRVEYHNWGKSAVIIYTDGTYTKFECDEDPYESGNVELDACQLTIEEGKRYGLVSQDRLDNFAQKVLAHDALAKDITNKNELTKLIKAVGKENLLRMLEE
jgi:hypothetical protein